MIRVLKSSAGSGKTFNLAKTYIRHLLSSDDPRSYRHVLAVTFTNKATGEMKGRILKELSILSDEPSKSDYIDDFRKEFGSDSLIKKKARMLLVNILHEYGSFSVSTIDKFFQRTLKAFAREVGQYASYQVELDKPSLVHESVDRVLSSVNDQDKEGRALLGWLSESAMDGIEVTGKFNLERNLYSIASGLMSEEHREIVEKYSIDEDAVYSRENISELRKRVLQVMKSYPERLVNVAKRVSDEFSACGLDMYKTSSHFMYNTISKFLSAEQSKNLDKVTITDTFVRKASDPDQWFNKGDKYLADKVSSSLMEAVDDFVAFFDIPYKEYVTARKLYSGLHGLGILAEVRQQFQDLMKEKNVLSIDDSNVLLRKIIGEDDAPFIYEKLGVTLEHFLLDEFQDTSIVQWQNFLPLLRESESQGDPSEQRNLIVGDVKQSIYRFRGSDWKLLDEEVKKAFPSSDDGNPLRQNWRSLKEIVTFNNRFFHFAAGVLDANYGKGALLQRIYADVEQEVKCKDKAPGSVRVSYCGDNSTQEACVLSSIIDARKRGAKWSDIAILVRWNRIGSRMAGLLVDNGIPVVSDDSLAVSSCPVVRRLVSLLTLINDPASKVSTYLTENLGIELPSSWYSLVDLSEELLRRLKEVEPDSFEGSVPYVMAFVDDLQEWTSQNGNNLGEFLRHWADSDLKIASPSDADAVRVITVHKAKGLEFPFVIVPNAEEVKLSATDKQKWAVPQRESTFLEGMDPIAFSVNLSKNSVNTLFSEAYMDNKLLQYVDNMNTFYVALTRAEKELHVIGGPLDDKSDKEVVKFIPADGESRFRGPFPTNASNFSKVLYLFLKGGYESCQQDIPLVEKYLAPHSESCPESESGQEGGQQGVDVTEFFIGTPYDYSSMKRDEKDYLSVSAGYPSFPLAGPRLDDTAELPEGNKTVSTRSRLRFRSDAADFFRIGSDPGIGSSPRLRGIVLHEILSKVNVPSDLEGAVRQAMIAGDLDKEDAEGYFGMLSDLIKGVSPRGWFPTDPTLVSNESSIIDLEGKVYRPDRVVKAGGRLIIIDYKFVEDIEASRRSSECHYKGQVSGYMNLYRQMGWKSVSGAIWYISLSEKGKSHVTEIG